MGNYISNLIPCKRGGKKVIIPEVPDESLKSDDINITDALKYGFICPFCERDLNDIPQLLNIPSNNDIIELKCLKKGEYFEKSLEEYCQTIEKKNIVGECKKGCSKPVEEFCLGCNAFFCSECAKNHSKKIFKKKLKMKKSKGACEDCLCFQCINNDDKKNKKPKEHILVKIEEISSTCPIHGLKNNKCCFDCEKNVCEKCEEISHKKHLKGNEKYKERIEDARTVILQKDKKLSKMMEFYDMIKSSYESNPDNYIYKKNLIKIAECIKREKERNTSDSDLAIYRIDQIKKSINIKNEN